MPFGFLFGDDGFLLGPDLQGLALGHLFEEGYEVFAVVLRKGHQGVRVFPAKGKNRVLSTLALTWIGFLLNRPPIVPIMPGPGQ